MVHPGAKNYLQSGPLKIALAAGLVGAAGRAQTIGFFRYANTHRRNWDIRLIQSRAEFTVDIVRDYAQKGLAGLVTGFPGQSGVGALLAELGIPVVLMDVNDPDLDIRRKTVAGIQMDDMEIGRRGALHFLSLGNFRSYGFVHDARLEIWSQLRGNAFRTILSQQGHAVQTFRLGVNSGKNELGTWLAGLPHPAAIMTDSDLTALQVLDICHEHGLPVPQRIAVLGVDNDELLCMSTRPALSSVFPDFEDEGFRAGSLLNELLMGHNIPKKIFCPVRELIERDSTHPVQPSVQLVERAVAFIEDHAVKGVRPIDVVRHLGVSRRLADLRFRQLQGKSILEAILDCRLEAVCRQLRGTTSPISRIAASCGFGSATRLTHLFKKRYGISMTEWRRQETL